MISLLARAQLRQFWRQRWQMLLALLGIAVGVAVVVAVDLANGASREAMGLASERLDGSATHAIVGPGERVDETRYAELRLRWRQGDPLLADVSAMAPVIVADVVLENAAGVTASVQLLGLDPTADVGMRAVAPGIGGAGADLLVTAGAALLDAETARRLDIQPEQTLQVPWQGQRHEVTVLDTFGSADRVLGQGLLVMDVASAQELLGWHGRLSRIDLRRQERAADGALRRWLERAFPGLVVRPPGTGAVPLDATLRIESLAERAADTRALASSFQLNLAALGLLALVVGLFLVHGTLSFMVLRRQREFGRLRALGVRPGELRRMILLEALVLATLGVLLGLLLGWWLAGRLLGAITVTLEGLYGQVAIGALLADPVALTKGALVGLAGTLLAAWPAARRAGQASPARLLAGGDQPRLLPARARWSRVLLLILAGAAALTPALGYGGGLLAIAAWLGAVALLTPWLVAGLLSGLDALARRGLSLRGRMLLRETVRGLNRSGVATAALVVALATAVGMGLMVDSFRDSVERWLQTRLSAPLHVQLVAETDRLPSTLEAALQADDVQGAVSYLGWDDRIEGQPVRINRASRLGQVPPDLGLDLIAGQYSETGVMLTEPLARRLQRGPGDTVTVPLPTGSRELPVTGIVREYGAGVGRLIVPAELAPALAGNLSVEVFTAPEAVAATAAALLAAAPEGSRVRRNDELLSAARQVFDQTFRITGLLQTIAGLVAAIGLFGALAALGLQRRTQYGVLRTLGVPRAGPATQNLAEAVLLALAAALIALPVGILVAVVLVDVVNLRAFHWSLSLSLPPMLFLQALLVAVLAALLAALGPAIWLWRTPPQQLLAEVRAEG